MVGRFVFLLGLGLAGLLVGCAKEKGSEETEQTTVSDTNSAGGAANSADGASSDQSATGFAVSEAEIETRKNNLKQIVLAFHNHHDVHKGFPAAGVAGQPGAGLSWRVHLLPFLEEVALYQRFKLDEPWDSPHNKALIAEMPAVFAGRCEPGSGRSSIHVMVGEGTPFGDGTHKPRFAEIRDGSSNTLLMVEAGSDVGAEWTRPGGIAFDRETPTAGLGDVSPWFLATLCDGMVLPILANPDRDMFRNLIQHNDGNPVDPLALRAR